MTTVEISLKGSDHERDRNRVREPERERIMIELEPKWMKWKD